MKQSANLPSSFAHHLSICPSPSTLPPSFTGTNGSDIDTLDHFAPRHVTKLTTRIRSQVFLSQPHDFSTVPNRDAEGRVAGGSRPRGPRLGGACPHACANLRPHHRPRALPPCARAGRTEEVGAVLSAWVLSCRGEQGSPLASEGLSSGVSRCQPWEGHGSGSPLARLPTPHTPRRFPGPALRRHTQ